MIQGIVRVYARRRLTPAESRNSAIERELLGVVWAVEYFRPNVWGRQFLIKTDHKPLVCVGGLKETSARVTRWKEKLATYTFTIIHTKGKDNVVVDFLSRMVNALYTPMPPSEGWDLLRRRVEDGPDLPVVLEARARQLPTQPGPIRGSGGDARLLWSTDTLDDKSRQVNVRITPGDAVCTTYHRVGRNRVWELSVGAQA
ncbi:hypothetical protein AAG570_008419 [Ranatra chinensis]|uniref:Reverse transcriptase RNase H-like domain-containing protein n=1 Tax=Ranatra chinensis TaxID=642074 RepID=A0ABD0YR53_9HEMI